MDLFNDIELDNNSELSNSIMKKLIPIEIGELYIKALGTKGYQFPVVQDHYLLILDDEPQHCTGQYKTRECDILPYSYNMLSCLFSFNESFTRLNYIQVYPALYENNDKIGDDDQYAIIFANKLFNEYDIITDKIIYEVNDKRKRFYLQTSDKRQITSDQDKLTLGFIQNFPLLLNSSENQLATNVYIRQCSLENEKTCVELFKQLSKQFNYVLFNTSTCFIEGIPFYMYNKMNKEFFSTIIENSDMVNDIDDYAIIDRRLINILNKLQLTEMLNSKKSLYKSLIESIAVSVKKSLNEDRDDHGHNAPSSHLKQRLQGVLNNKFGYASLRQVSRRIGNRDFYIANRTNVSNYPSKFELAVVERKKISEDNFRIPISRKGEMDILSDDNIKYVLFPRYIGTSGIDYIVYILDKDNIKEIYDNLKSILDRCKEEIKQGKRDRKTIKVNKSISDKWKNFLAPTAGNDGLCLSNNCLKELAVDTFKLYDKGY